MNNVLSIYFYHDAAIAVKIGNIYRSFEVERYNRQRYSDLNIENYKEVYDTIFHIIKEEYGVVTFDTCLYNKGMKSHDKIFGHQMEYVRTLWSIKEFVSCSHHNAHASGTFYLSDFEESLVFSYDGGGWYNNSIVDFFNIYYYNRNIGEKKLLHRIGKDLGTPYGVTAIPVSEIHKEPILPPPKFLSFAGKLMGLSAYGKANYYNAFYDFYNKYKKSSTPFLWNKIKELNIGHTIDINSLEGKVSWDFAASSQKAFEDTSINLTENSIKQYNLPICLTGGCALNVLLNERLRQLYHLPIFVSPFPNDCGIAIGMIMDMFPPNDIPNITYGNFPLLDKENLSYYISKYAAKTFSYNRLCKLLQEGKIIGIAKGNSECGPRALGNRSIICDPSFADMKDTLNAKVKFREWYRPFAPFVQLEDANTYFNFDWKSPYMSFAPEVREEYRNVYPSITHVDGTARLQTVNTFEHEMFYDLLAQYKNTYGKGVLLNTSFNIKGKPILTRIEDAIQVLENTEIDAVCIEDYIFEKNSI